MPGAGSALDKNDHRLIRQLTREVGRLADELEQLNDTLEADGEGEASNGSAEEPDQDEAANRGGN